MNERAPAAPETEVSWRAADPGTPIYAADGTRIGTLRQVAADDNEDIFHGLVVDRGDGPAALVPRDAVASIERDRIDVNLGPEAVDRLPEWSDAGRRRHLRAASTPEPRRRWKLAAFWPSVTTPWTSRGERDP